MIRTYQIDGSDLDVYEFDKVIKYIAELYKSTTTSAIRLYIHKNRISVEPLRKKSDLEEELKDINVERIYL